MYYSYLILFLPHTYIQVVITYVSYLCSRLLSIQKETRAARTIQLAWRKHKLGKMRDVYQVRKLLLLFFVFFFSLVVLPKLQRNLLSPYDLYF